MKLNCLIKDTSIIQDIHDAIIGIAKDRFENGQKIDFKSMYGLVRDNGVEIDAESFGSIYNKAFGDINSDAITTRTEISEIVGRQTKDLQNSIVNDILGKEKAPTVQEVGNISPEKRIANMVGRLFSKNAFPNASETVKSEMKQMEDLLKKSMAALLPKKSKVDTKTTENILEKFFNVDAFAFNTLSGGVNNMETLHTELKKEMNSFVSGITKGLNENEAEIVQSKWDDYTENLMKSMYSLLLGKAENNYLLNELMKDVTIDGKSVVDSNDNIIWSKLSRSGKSDEINQQVRDKVSNIKDAEGNPKYNERQARMIADHVTGLFEQKKAAAIAKDVTNDRLQRQSIQNLISDFIKDKGFFDLMKDKEGGLTSSKTNWNEIIKKLQSTKNKKNTIDSLVSEVRDYFENKIDARTPQEKKEKQDRIDKIAKKLESLLMDKLSPKSFHTDAFDKIIALKNVNNANAFEKETQYAINKLVGVSDLDQQTLNKLQQIATIAENIKNAPTDVDGININRGDYALQAIGQLNRQIKELLREYKTDKSMQQKIVKSLVDYMNTVTSTLLINPKNMSENVITNVATELTESLGLALQSPGVWINNIIPNIKTFWSAFLSHIGGGSSLDIISDEELSIDVPTGERLRPSKLREIREKPIETLISTPAMAVNTFMRVFMNSFDVAIGQTILRKHFLMSTYTALKNMGYSQKEATTMLSSALNIPDADMQDINNTVDAIIAHMKSVGLTPTQADKALIKQQVSLSQIELVLAQQVQNSEQMRQSTKAILESAKSTSRILTGKKRMPLTDWISRSIYAGADLATSIQRGSFKATQEYEQKGDLSKAARAELGAEVAKNTMGRFAGGMANFMVLALNATPYGAIQGLSLMNQAKQFLKNNVDANSMTSGDADAIKRYYELSKLAKSVFLRAAVGTLAMTGYALKKSFGDDDDDDWIDNLMKTKSGRLFLYKELPLGMALMATIMSTQNKNTVDRLERMAEYLGQLSGTDRDAMSRLVRDMRSAKTESEHSKSVYAFLASFPPSGNLNQAEQVTKTIDVVKSAFDKDKIGAVKRDETLTKATYAQLQSLMDYYLQNGMIQTITRAADPNKPLNRFEKK